MNNTASLGQFQELKDTITHQYEVIERMEQTSQETFADLKQKVSQIEKIIAGSEGLTEVNENNFESLSKAVRDLSLRVKR